MNCRCSLRQRRHRAIAATAVSIIVVQCCSRIMASDVQTPIEPKVTLPELTIAGIVQSKDPGTLPEILSRQAFDPVARDQLRAKEQASANPVAGRRAMKLGSVAMTSTPNCLPSTFPAGLV